MRPVPHPFPVAPDSDMQFFDANRVAALLPYRPLIQALREAFRAGATVPPRHHHTVEVAAAPPATMLLMPAWGPGGPLVVKIVSVFPGNGALGLPAVMGSVLVLEEGTGRPLAILEGGELTTRRTAAASALAAELLVPPGPVDLLVVGTGRVARELARAHPVVRPVRSITIWGRTPERARTLADEIRAEWAAGTAPGAAAAGALPEVRAVTDLRGSVEGATLISCATLSSEPLVLGEWLRPGAHLDLVGAFTPTMRETDAAAVGRSRVFVDTREGAAKEGGDLLLAEREGAFRFEDVAGELRELCQGTVAGRRDPREITLFKSVGTALEDLAAARLALHRASGGR